MCICISIGVNVRVAVHRKGKFVYKRGHLIGDLERGMCMKGKMSGCGSNPNTTFVEADPSNFRAVVQKLTGASDDPWAPKLPLTLMGLKRPKPNFKLHERRNAAAKKVDLPMGMAMGMGMGMVMASPVSPLDFLARGSPRTPQTQEEEEEEERAIAEKGFYLHPSPTASQPPQLLTLFPLHSPSHSHTNS